MTGIDLQGEGCHAFRDHLVENQPEIAPGYGVDSEGGLVEKQQPWLMDQRAAEAKLAAPH